MKRAVTASTLFFALATSALAGEHAYPTPSEKWLSECGSCHVAYPPELLPAASWRAVMAGLDRHFGANASLDAPTARELQAFAEANGATGKRAAGPATLRITETSWFRRKHDEVAPGAWKRPAVKSAANCAACHGDAERGNYSERSVRIPR